MPDTADTGGYGEKYLIFSVLGQMYGFPARIVGEIAMFDAVYPLPLVPPCVLGIINRYSIPYALFDIGLLLFDSPSSRGKVLVLKDSVERIAFLIDDINGIAEVPEEELMVMEKDSERSDGAETISASFRWNDGEVFVLDVGSILAPLVAD